MNILLINSNPVVSRLISLCIRDENTVLEEVGEASDIKLNGYAIVFVDDASCLPPVKKLLKNIQTEKKVLLLGSNTFEDPSEDFDEVLKKPFLPSQVTAMLEALNDGIEVEKEERKRHFIFPLSTEEVSENTLPEAKKTKKIKEENTEAAKILDFNEITRIRSLLEEENQEDEIAYKEEDYETRKREVITEHLEADGLEIVSEDKIIDILSHKTEKSKEKKAKKKLKKEANYTFEEALIAAIEGMKVKKIKKLLKDADITININFKDKK